MSKLTSDQRQYIKDWLTYRFQPVTDDTVKELAVSVSQKQLLKAYSNMNTERSFDADCFDDMYILCKDFDRRRKEAGIPEDDVLWSYYTILAEEEKCTLENYLTIKSKGRLPIHKIITCDLLTTVWEIDNHIFKDEVIKDVKPISEFNIYGSLYGMLATVLAYFKGDFQETRKYIGKCGTEPSRIENAYDNVLLSLDEEDDDIIILANYYLRTEKKLRLLGLLEDQDCVVLILKLAGANYAPFVEDCYKSLSLKSALVGLIADPVRLKTLENFKQKQFSYVKQAKIKYLTKILQQEKINVKALDNIEVNYKSKDNDNLNFYKFCRLGVAQENRNLQRVSKMSKTDCMVKVQRTLKKIDVTVDDHILREFAVCCDDIAELPSDVHKTLYVIASYKYACMKLRKMLSQKPIK